MTEKEYQPVTSRNASLRGELRWGGKAVKNRSGIEGDATEDGVGELIIGWED